MGYMEFQTAAMNILLNASMFAQRQNDPDLAMINIEAINQMIDEDYRVDTNKILPSVQNRDTHDKQYLSESLKHSQEAWHGYRTLLLEVMSAMANYTRAEREQFMAQ